MSTSNRGPGPVPNRWLHCPRKSESIIVEKFLAFKTPLSKEFKDQLPVACMFPPEMLFDYCKMTKMTLGLWVDLTNTKRFYDRKVVEDRGAQYFKLNCRGHGETPSLEQTESFIAIVEDFINERPFDIIAVHCTHGFNRTGFLLVSYMVEKMDFSVEAALATFAKARPPGIYKQDYINELFRRYETEEDAIQAPELPAWSLEFDDSAGRPQKRKFNDAHSSTSQQAMSNTAEVGQIETLEDDDQLEEVDEDGNNAAANNGGQPRKKRRREMVVKNATFMAGVSGVTLVTDQPRLSQIQQKVQNMCGWDKSGFPGSQPVSMDRENIRRLHEIPYRVSWKADGTRYMMLVNKRNEIYFLDRNNSCFEVQNLTFLKAGALQDHLEDTLLDGEMVLDKHQGQITPRYLVYDIVRIGNRDVGKEEFFPHRINCIKREIIDPRYDGIRKGIINRAHEPFGVRNKEFWDITQSTSLLGEKFAKSLLHEPDGLIFQPSLQPYKAGVCPDVFKWKPCDMNSVDFRLKITTEGGPGILPRKICVLYVGGSDAPFAQMKFTKELKELNNKIVECTVNQQGQWEFMRERTDKTLPNSYNTAVSVVESIRHPVNKQDLLHYIQMYGFRDDSMKMPPPKNQNHNHHHQQQQHRQQQQQQQQQQHQQQRPPQHEQQETHQHEQQFIPSPNQNEQLSENESDEEASSPI